MNASHQPPATSQKFFDRAGFTLIELLVVLMIIGIITSLVTVNLATARSRARDHRRQADLATVAGALELFRSEKKHYPFATAEPYRVGFGSSSWTFLESRQALVPRYLGTIPTDPKFSTDQTFGKGYVYATNQQQVSDTTGQSMIYGPGSLFVLDATLEQAVENRLMTIGNPEDNSKFDFFKTGFYQIDDHYHYRVASR